MWFIKTQSGGEVSKVKRKVDRREDGASGFNGGSFLGHVCMNDEAQIAQGMIVSLY